MSIYFSHILFEKALINLYERQKIFQSSPWDELISTFIEFLRMESELVGETAYENLSTLLTGHASDYPFSEPIRNQLQNAAGYKREFKEILSKYSAPFSQQNYRVTDWSDFMLVSFRLYYLLMQNPSMENNEQFLQFFSPFEGYDSFWVELEDNFKTFDIDRQTKVIDFLEQQNIEEVSESMENLTMSPAKRLRLDLDKYKYVPRKKLAVEPKVDSKVEPTVDPTVEPNIQAKVEPKVEPKIQAKFEPKVQAKVEFKVEPKATKQPKKKSKIPSAVRRIVWNTYIGSDNASGKCLVCTEGITMSNFECGHVHSECEGGETIIDNLRPICGHCNKSIGAQHMEEFMERYGIKRPANWFGIA